MQIRKRLEKDVLGIEGSGGELETKIQGDEYDCMRLTSGLDHD